MRRIALVPFILLAMPALALAQDSTIEVGSLFGTLRPYVVELVGVLAAAIVAWLASIVRSKFNLDIEQRHRDALQTAIKNAAGLVLARIENKASAASITISNPLLAAGAKYALDAVPDAIKFFGLSPEAVAEKVKAQLGLLTAPTPPAA